MDLRPVNSINNDVNTIRVSDGNSPIRLIFKDAKGDVINLYDKIDYFYLTKDNDKFYSVTDISYDGDEVIIRLPKLRKGKYKAEIRDKDGSIYPANEDLYILLRRSFEDDKDIYYFGHREDILNSVEPMVIQHIEQNPNKFKGERGPQGFPGREGLRGKDGKDGKDGVDGEKGDKGDPGLPGKDGEDGEDGSSGYKGNIMDFGAVGDGLTDDSDAFIRALEHSSEIYLPKDYTFAITNVSLNSVKIHGGGKLKWLSNSNTPILRISGRTIINDVSFDGNYLNQDNVNRTAISITDGSGTVFNGCVFKNFNGVLINTEYNPEIEVGLKITNNIFENTTFLTNGNVINIKYKNSYIDGNTFKNIGNGHCVRIGLMDSDDLDVYTIDNTIISNNLFMNTEHNGITLELNSTRTLITGNTFKNLPQAIKMEGLNNNTYDVRITDNHFENIELDTALNLKAPSVIFNHNKCIDLGGGAMFGDNFICSNNEFIRCGRLDNGYSIANFDASAKGIVSENIIVDPVFRGIVISSGDSQIVNNQVFNAPDSAIRIANKNFICSANYIKGSSIGFLLVSNSEGFILTNNVVIDCVTNIQNANNDGFINSVVENNIGI